MFKNLKNESGIVLLTVLAISVAMIIVAVSILSLNINQVTQGEKQIERIRSEEIAKGVYWNAYTQGASTGTFPVSTTPPISLYESGTTTNSTVTRQYSAVTVPQGGGVYDITVMY